MGNPGHFFNVIILDRPTTSDIQEVTQSIQVALHCGIDFISFHQRNNGTLGSTTNWSAHLERSTSRSRGLQVIMQQSICTGIVKVLKGGSLESYSSIQFSKTVMLSSGNFVFSTLLLLHNKYRIIVKYELDLGGVAIAAPRSNKRDWI